MADMSGTAPYKALTSANNADDMRSILVELRTTNRILIVLVLATFLRSFF